MHCIVKGLRLGFCLIWRLCKYYLANPPNKCVVYTFVGPLSTTVGALYGLRQGQAVDLLAVTKGFLCGLWYPEYTLINRGGAAIEAPW